MKKYIFSSILAIVAAAGFTACSDDEVKYDGPGQWDANAGYADIYFKSTSKTESIDPAAATEYSFPVYRRVEHQYTWGKDSEGNDSIIDDKIVTPLPALTVKPTIIENTDNAFTVSDAVFAEGDTVTTITASFPNATIGKQHTLAVKIEGADYVSSYSNSVLYTYNVTRVKWNNIGKGKFRDDFWFESSWEVDVMQRDDDHSYYRIMDPFGGSGEELDGNQSEYVELHITKKGDAINGITMTENGVVDWYRICTGYFHSSYSADVWAMHPQNFTSASLNTADVYAKSKVVSYLEDGKTPGQIQLAPYWYMFGVGGWNKTDAPTIFINLPGFVETYEATIDDDFEFADEFMGVWKSGKLGTSTTAMLQKGTCVTTTDDCDKTFEATYGTPYLIKSPYAEGYDLLFCAKGKKIVLAPEYEDPQPLGITAMGEDVYAVINTAESSFAESIITLNITFVSLDKKGNIAVEYGTANEQLLNLTYSEVGTGVYTYGVEALSNNGGSAYEGTENSTLYQCNQLPNTYYLKPWASSEDGLQFTIGDDGYIRFYQFTGDSYSGYGDIYFMDLEYFNPAYTQYLGKFNAETNTYSFAGGYYIPAADAGWGLVEETFVLGAEAPAEARRISASELGVKLDRTMKAVSRFTPKKVENQQGRYGKLTRETLAE